MKKKSEDLNRYEETRFFETREFEQDDDDFRRQVEMSWKDPFYIDPSIIPHGMVYGWKREHFNKFGGEEDKGNMADVLQKRWTPVPAERHPHLCSVSAYGENKNTKGYIEKGGLILFERPKRFNDIEIEVLNKETYKRTFSNEALRNHADLRVEQNSAGYGYMRQKTY